MVVVWTCCAAVVVHVVDALGICGDGLIGQWRQISTRRQWPQPPREVKDVTLQGERERSVETLAFINRKSSKKERTFCDQWQLEKLATRERTFGSPTVRWEDHAGRTRRERDTSSFFSPLSLCRLSLLKATLYASLAYTTLFSRCTQPFLTSGRGVLDALRETQPSLLATA